MITTIKNLFYAVLLSAFAANACSCSGSSSDEPSKPNSDITITVNPDAITVSPEATTEKISITANADWSISSDADWCKCFPSGGLKNATTVITVTLAANSGAEQRTASLTISSGTTTKTVSVIQQPSPVVTINASTLCFGAQGGSASLTVTANIDWKIEGAAEWLSFNPAQGSAGTCAITVNCTDNSAKTDREANITIGGDAAKSTLKIVQYSDEINTPEGYNLVWNDEFNTPDGSSPDLSKWYYDEWAPGFVNNELQRYVAGALGNDKTAEIIGGVLNITARKSGSQVISARMNTKELWLYGYFEARLKLPKGKGTWPAFWMMPADGGNWPHCGEIDIMEEVGTNPNYTSSSIHCTDYNHTIGTQKTAERLTPGAEDEFHVYALEWTPDFIRTYVDGKQLFYFANDKKGDQNSWPFDKPFHPILNLAWGGAWGGMNGVDESALPATYQIDYLRIFQKL